MNDRVGAGKVRVLGKNFWGTAERNLAPFAERVRIAGTLLAQEESTIVYVNSFAASEFAIAAKLLGKRVILHSHEKSAEIKRLLAHQLTQLDILTFCDAIVLAAEDLASDLLAVFGPTPHPTLNFGIAVDVEEIVQLADAGSLRATTAAGTPLVPGSRYLVGMVGHASPRKGPDIFLETAKLVPECDFIWVGDWKSSAAAGNSEVYRSFRSSRLGNLYVTGGVDNPFKYIKRFELFFLSSREDPNPLVLAEATVLQVPIMCFSRSTAVTDLLGRNEILLHGTPNAADAARIIKRLASSPDRPAPNRKPISPAIRDRFDVSRKINALIELIDSLQPTTQPSA